MISTNPEKPTSGIWRRLTVVGVLLYALAYLGFYLVEVQLDYRQLLAPCEGPDCNWAAITSAEAAVLEDWGLTTSTYAALFIAGSAITVVGYWLLGGLIFWRKSADRIGLFMSLAMVGIPIATFADSDNVGASYPALLFPTFFLNLLGVNLLTILLYLFPNGRFYPRRAPWFMVLTMVSGSATMMGFHEMYSVPVWARTVLTVLMAAGFIAALFFQIWRYVRDASTIERQQTRWVLLGFAAFIVGPFVWGVLYPGGARFEAGQERLLVMSVGWLLINVMQLVLPGTLTIAILQHRLWSIDLIIRRTLIYGSLTATLALLYFGAVIMLQAIFGRLTGDADSPLVTVFSTLVIAALFNPLRLRLQRLIDRRFYRSRYDAEQSVARFAARARDEVDLHHLAFTLLATVDETMRPEKTSLWMDQ